MALSVESLFVRAACFLGGGVDLVIFVGGGAVKFVQKAAAYVAARYN